MNTDIQWKAAGSKPLVQPFSYTHIPLFTKLPFISSHLFHHTWDLPSKWISFHIHSLCHPKCKTPLNFCFSYPTIFITSMSHTHFTLLLGNCVALASHTQWHKWISLHWILWKGCHMFNLTHYTYASWWKWELKKAIVIVSISPVAFANLESNKSGHSQCSEVG